MIARLSALLAPLLIAACAGGTIDAPSLGQRPYEREVVPVPDAAREPASTLDAALKTRLGGLIGQAEAAHGDFVKAQAKVEAAIARAGRSPAGSESWIGAQQDLSALDANRGPLQAIEAEIDGLRADPANATPANREAITAAQERVQALADQESAAIAALGSKLKP